MIERHAGEVLDDDRLGHVPILPRMDKMGDNFVVPSSLGTLFGPARAKFTAAAR
jgi:hypothetical protein